ncbi:MAG: hypothetical protein NTV57_16045 [Cyanobacteria bacterium]|nr:hypothetical protein [Cyanobacteriota bacterium]
MTALSQELSKKYPGSVGISVAGFHAALAAIGREMHEETQAGHQSLWAWWQWLDDEGYERQAFAEVLCQLGRTTIGDEAFAALTAYSKSIENDPDGISTLIEYVNKHYPDLTEEIAKIEKLAEEEDIQIQNMAGGMSKVAKGALIGVGTLAGVSLVGLVGKGIHSYWKRNKAERESRLVEKAEMKATNDVQQETEKLENVAPDKANIESKFADDRPQIRGATNEQRTEYLRSRAADVAKHIEYIKVDSRYNVLKKLEKTKIMQTVAEADRDDVMFRIIEKFEPSPKIIEIMAEKEAQNLRGEMFPAGTGLRNKWIELATRAELRKDRKALGEIVDTELKPEFEAVFSDSEIDSLYDLDKLIVHKTLGMDPSKIREGLQFWGSKESIYANAFDLRYPSVKVGLREYIRSVAMNDMATFNREQALENLDKYEYSGLEKYLKYDVHEKMTKEAKRQAIKDERLIKEKTDFKQELKEYLSKDKANIEKEIKENLDSEAQAIKEKEAEEAKGALDTFEKSEKERISAEITSEVDDVIIETKQATRAAEKKAENSLDDI